MHYLSPKQAVVTSLLFVMVYVSGSLKRGGWYRIGQRLGWESASVIRTEHFTSAVEVFVALLLLAYSVRLLRRSRGCETHDRTEKVALLLDRIFLGVAAAFSVLDLFIVVSLLYMVASARAKLWT